MEAKMLVKIYCDTGSWKGGWTGIEVDRAYVN